MASVTLLRSSCLKEYNLQGVYVRNNDTGRPGFVDGSGLRFVVGPSNKLIDWYEFS